MDFRYVYCPSEIHVPSLPLKPTAIPFIYSIPFSTKISDFPEILGIDLASAFVVHSLSLIKSCTVLDLCSAPCAKLVFASKNCQSITGVDINKQRLYIGKSLIKRFRIQNARLFCLDGVTFNIGAPNESFLDLTSIPLEKSENFVTPLYAPKKLSQDPQISVPYDRVIVDTECTHNASFSHQLKYKESPVLNEKYNHYREIMNDQVLSNLQTNLLSNGWINLKFGGVLIYSTCSDRIEENENILDLFLDSNCDAYLLELSDILPGTKGLTTKSLKARRFGEDGVTSGMFIAKIWKIDLVFVVKVQALVRGFLLRTYMKRLRFEAKIEVKYLNYTLHELKSRRIELETQLKEFET